MKTLATILIAFAFLSGCGVRGASDPGVETQLYPGETAEIRMLIRESAAMYDVQLILFP